MASLRTSRDTLSLRNNELSTLLTTTQSELQTTANSLLLAEADLAAKTSELQTLALSSQPLEQKLVATVTELANAQTELSELHALNLDFDSRLSSTLSKREEVQRAKVKGLKEEISRQQQRILDLESERKGMVKALMGFWGREEFGGEEEYDFVDGGEGEGKGKKERKSQKFRYRFAGT
jgi:chromosome segregation ATPase